MSPEGLFLSSAAWAPLGPWAGRTIPHWQRLSLQPGPPGSLGPFPCLHAHSRLPGLS